MIVSSFYILDYVLQPILSSFQDSLQYLHHCHWSAVIEPTNHLEGQGFRSNQKINNNNNNNHQKYKYIPKKFYTFGSNFKDTPFKFL